jgi:hypothetical protein
MLPIMITPTLESLAIQSSDGMKNLIILYSATKLWNWMGNIIQHCQFSMKNNKLVYEMLTLSSMSACRFIANKEKLNSKV